MLARMSLRKRLIVSFSIVAVLSLVLAYSGYRGIVFGIKAQDEISEDAMPIIETLQALNRIMLECQKTERTLSASFIEEEQYKIQRKNIDTYWKQAAETTQEYETLARRIGDPEEIKCMEEVLHLWNIWFADHEKVIKAGLSGEKDAPERTWELTFGPARVSLKNLEKALHDEVAAQVKRAENINKTFDKRAAAVKTMAVALGLIIAFASLAFGLLTSYSLSNSLNRVAGSLDEGAHQVDSAAGQLTASSQAMAEGSSEQAASLEETASAMEEMSAMTKRNSGSAMEAKGLSDQANRSVNKADESMTGLVRQMNDISTMSEEVGKIIKTIDEIAFQTNLLALNAAVEAARAGEAGAGFAVVADEVRNLAQRAAGAAKSTAELIEGSLRKIREGTGLVERTSTDFREVVTVVRKVMELVAEVAAASAEQSRGIAEVSTAIDQMDKVTQSNAASAEEIAAASEELNAQTMSLQDVVRELRIIVGGVEAVSSMREGRAERGETIRKRQEILSGLTLGPAATPSGFTPGRKKIAAPHEETAGRL